MSHGFRPPMLAVAAALAMLALGGCSLDESKSPFQPGDHPDAQHFDTAPSAAAIGGATLELTAEAWRDFMPIVEPEGRPMVVVARITSQNDALPPGLTVENVMVRFEGEIWFAGAPDDQYILNGRSLEAVVRGGPRWGPGVQVDVLVRLGTADGADHYLVVHGVEVTRTD